MANKPGTANFFPDAPEFPSMGTFQPVYGKFDLTTYIQGASDYEIMAFLVGKYNACLEAYSNITKLSTDTITACKQLQNWINSWFDNLDVQEELNKKIDSMVQDGSFGTLLHQTFDEQINNQTTSAVTAWLVANVTPTGSAVVVDKSLSIEGAAADAKVTGKYIDRLAIKSQLPLGIAVNISNNAITFSIDNTKSNFIWSQNGYRNANALDASITTNYDSATFAFGFDLTAASNKLIVSKINEIIPANMCIIYIAYINNNIVQNELFNLDKTRLDTTLSISDAPADAKSTGDAISSVNGTLSAIGAQSKQITTSTKLYNLIELNNFVIGKAFYRAVGDTSIGTSYDSPNTALSNPIAVESLTSLHLYDTRGAQYIQVNEYDESGKLIKWNQNLKDITTSSTTKYIRVQISDISTINDIIKYKDSVCNGNFSCSFNRSLSNSINETLTNSQYKVVGLYIQPGYYTNNTYYQNDMYMGSKVSVIPGTTVKISCYLRANSLPLAEFLDYNNQVIGTTGTLSADTVFDNANVAIPAGCFAINVNSYRDNNTALRVCVPYDTVSRYKIGYTGDSICYGLGYAGGYASIIDKMIGTTSNNIGVSGGHIATDRSDVFIISNSISMLDNDIQALIMEGGINDYSNYVTLGSITDNYTDPINQKTFYGGLEKLFRDANNTFPEIPKAFIIVHKVNNSCVKTSSESRENTFEDYIDAIYACARKYSIDVIDINKSSGFNTYNADIKRKYTYKDSDNPTGDGLHPNIAGYTKWYVPPIVRWIESKKDCVNTVLMA